MSEIDKSESDEREYKCFILPNGLKVLLVYEENLTISSAALDVNVGSKHDGEVLGLAHFLEHLLFMGTKKYPEENEYSTYLSDHGGSSNAFTCYEHTNYYFEVVSEYLEGALDRFSQFFISPLLNEDSIERERQAVDSEHNKNKELDVWRIDQLIKHLSNKEHPYNRFTTGNINTLQVPIEKVIDFYNENYSPEKMCLSVCSNQNISSLEKIVKKMFNQIKKKITLPFYSLKSMPIIKEDFGRQIFYQTLGQTKKLIVFFQSQKEKYQVSTSKYVSYIINEKGKKSLYSLLKKKDLATSVEFDKEIKTNQFELYSISLRLTEKGVKETEKILCYVFKCLNMIRTCGQSKRIVCELEKIERNRFRYLEKIESIDYACELAEAMHLYEPKDILKGEYLFKGVEEDLFNETLSCFTAENCFVVNVNPELKEKEYFIEPFYQSKYHIERFSDSFISILSSCLPQDKELSLPEENMFLSTEETFIISELGNSIPIKIYEERNICVWYCKKKTPRTECVFWLKSDLCKTPEKAVSLKILQMMIEEHLSFISYQGTEAMLELSIELDSRGLILNIGGLSSKQNLFLSKVLDSLLSFSIDKDIFETFKKTVSEDIESTEQNCPYKHALSGLYKKIIPNYFSNEDLKNISVSHEDVVLIWNEIKENSYELECLLSGNCTKEHSINLAKKVFSLCKKLSEKTFQLDLLDLPKKEVFKFKKVFDRDSSVVLCVKGSEAVKLKEVSMLFLLFDLINEEFFDQLRTKEQLGYICFCSLNKIRNCFFFLFIVQSKRTADFLDKRIEKFVSSIEEMLLNTSKNVFEEKKEARKTLFLKKERSLSEQNSAFFEEIRDQTLIFDWKEKCAHLVNEISFEELFLLYKKLFKENLHSVSVYVES